MKKLFMSCVTLLIIVSLIISCCRTEKVHNSDVKDFVNEISQMEYVQKAKVHNMAFSLTIDIYVEDEFNIKYGSEKIFESAKKCFSKEIIYGLMNEFEQKYPPDTHIYIRNTAGEIQVDFAGTCYKNVTPRNSPPDYEEYIWRKYEWQQ